MAEEKTQASEAGHYYWPDGTPCYEIDNASKPGTKRPTTLRDAKKLGLYASVTTIMQVLAKPMLIKWQLRQAILAALTMPISAGMTEDSYLDSIIDDAARQGRDAMDLGTKIHAQVQGMYENELWEPWAERYCVATGEAIAKEFGKKVWVAEKSFGHPLQFAGKCDLYSEDRTVLLDFKTTQSNGENLKKAGYPEHLLQLAAYRLGLGLEKASLANVYISTTVPGEIYIKIWTDEQALQATKEWIKLLDYWKCAKKFMQG